MSDTSGHEKLWEWFELSRASFLVLPRVLLHEMPDKWQGALAKLLREYDEAFPNQPEIRCRVQITDLSGKLVRTPRCLVEYRHPDKSVIDAMRRQS